MDNLKQLPLATKAALALSAVGSILAFLGVCIAQAAIVYSVSNPLDMGWYLFFYSVFVEGAIVYLIMNDMLAAYRPAVIGFIAAFLGTAPLPLSILVATSNRGIGQASVGCGLAAAGLILIVIPFFGLMMLIGATESKLPFAHTTSAQKPTETFRPATNQPQASANNQKEVVTRAADVEMVPTPTVKSPTDATRPASEIPKMAKAIYAYDANPADPNEVTFTKGESMMVLDSEGKWWQVKITKQDGHVVQGIAPSNYLQLV